MEISFIYAHIKVTYSFFYNIVGFQTNLTYSEQKRVFRMIPGLENAEFVRYGLMHRNTYICSPLALNENMSFKNKKNAFLAGQLTGVEGYVESAAMGILAAIYLDAYLENKKLPDLPINTMLGSLHNYIIHGDNKNFSPMNANYGILYGVNKHNHEECATKSLQLIDEWMKYAN